MVTSLITFLKEVPHIYIVFICFVILFAGYLITNNERVFDLSNTALGGVMGLAMRHLQKTENQAAENIEKAEINFNPAPGENKDPRGEEEAKL